MAGDFFEKNPQNTILKRGANSRFGFLDYWILRILLINNNVKVHKFSIVKNKIVSILYPNRTFQHFKVHEILSGNDCGNPAGHYSFLILPPLLFENVLITAAPL